MTEKMLKTWKQVGKFLGMSGASCKRAYRESLKTSDPMPLYVNGMIRAFPAKLRAWQERQKRKLSCPTEIADFLGISVRTLYRKKQSAIMKGDPMPISKGQAYPEELEVWMNKNE